MSPRITIDLQNGDTYFYLEQLSPDTRLDGFVPNAEMNNKRNKTISMRKDIFS